MSGNVALVRFIARLIERIKRWWRGAERVEDPLVQMRRAVIDAQGMLIEVKNATSVAIAAEKMLKKNFEEQVELSVLSEHKAAEAAAQGDDDLARHVLERKAVHDNLRVQYEKQWRLQREAVEVMKSHVRILTQDVDALVIRKNVLSAWQVLAHAHSLIAELQTFVASNTPPPGEHP